MGNLNLLLNNNNLVLSKYPLKLAIYSHICYKMSIKNPDYVQLDGLVALKIIKHCKEAESSGGSSLVQGVLLGLVESGTGSQGNRLEVTNCFPFPRHNEDDEQFDELAYQVEMMKKLRHVNVDHLHVGWYQSTYFGMYFNRALLDSQYNYQNSIRESVVIIYDPLRTGKGHLALKALRLSPMTMDLYAGQDFTPEKMAESNINFETIYEEVPIVLKNSHLMNALCCELEDKNEEENSYPFLDLATGPVLEKNLKLLMECVDELNQDVNRYFGYQRQAVKQKQAIQQYVAKRDAENMQRIARGEEPLPDEDIDKIFKPTPPPARLDALLWSSQINCYTEQISDFATQSFGKLFITDSLQSTVL